MKHRQYRNREEIIGSILESADKPDGMSKTRVMFNCFLSFYARKDSSIFEFFQQL